MLQRNVLEHCVLHNLLEFFFIIVDLLAGYIIGTPEANQIRADLWNYELTYVTNMGKDAWKNLMLNCISHGKWRHIPISSSTGLALVE